VLEHRAWWLLSLALAALALLGATLAPHSLDWEPALAASQPWRWWTPVAVHHNAWHLWSNLIALAALAWLAHSARVDRTMALAWALAWPLTHLGLALRPELAHYGGLSGVLHAGVAVVGVQLLRSARRLWGAAVLGALLAKVLLEQPWGPVLQADAATALAVAPWGHASGAAAGALCATVLAFTMRATSSERLS
jgi:rhomboid family GlyGly-CTERM serine protease